MVLPLFTSHKYLHLKTYLKAKEDAGENNIQKTRELERKKCVEMYASII